MNKKFKISLSGFDIGMLVAFAVVTLMGFGGWWYLSGQLQAAQDADDQAKKDFDSYSAKDSIIVSPANLKVLQANTALLKDQINPVISNYLLQKDNKLSTIGKEDPVAWKHDLDDEVRALNAAAKLHSVDVPGNFYFGFSRYESQSPGDEQTAVLSKQLKGINEIANILINAQVRTIDNIGRTYEEDPHSGGSDRNEGEHLPGFAPTAPGGAYLAYPFQIDFETSSENLRTVISELVKSPYLFVVRTVSISNSNLTSPQLGTLDQMAGSPTSGSVIDQGPGEVAAATPAKGPQYLFGNSLLKVKLRVDMIEWNAALTDVDSLAPPPTKPRH